jgi:hypothetical protein
MNCPYCYSEIHDSAVVCKVCSRELSLVKSLQKRIEELSIHSGADINLTTFEQLTKNQYEEKIHDLEIQNSFIESISPEIQTKEIFSPTRLIVDILAFVFVPLFLLITSHGVITILLDTKVLYLRIISILIPMYFGYELCCKTQRSTLVWFCLYVLLAIFAVIGMSWMTSLVDHSTILPKNLAEWKDVFYFAASISLSFLTGMLIGSFTYLKHHKNTLSHSSLNIFEELLLKILGKQHRPEEKTFELFANLEQTLIRISAFITTLLSILSAFKGL